MVPKAILLGPSQWLNQQNPQNKPDEIRPSAFSPSTINSPVTPVSPNEYFALKGVLSTLNYLEIITIQIIDKTR